MRTITQLYFSPTMLRVQTVVENEEREQLSSTCVFAAITDITIAEKNVDYTRTDTTLGSITISDQRRRFTPITITIEKLADAASDKVVVGSDPLTDMVMVSRHLKLVLIPVAERE